MSIYIGNDLEDTLKILEMENTSLRKHNDYHQVVHEIDHMSDLQASKEDFHPRVTVDQAERLCHRITLHFGRLKIETGALYYCI